MSYEPTEWQTGDVVTAEKLNHIENGVANASDGDVFICSFFFGDGLIYCDKTFEEIVQAYNDEKKLFAYQYGAIEGISIGTGIAMESAAVVVECTFHFWAPNPDVTHGFIYSTITITADGITDSYQEYTLTPAT